jgi:integrase
VDIDKDKTSAFQKVGECLYRYLPSGVYYARIKANGKEIRRSLRTTDRKLADRALRRLKDEQGQIDRSQGRLTLAELCDRYKKTVQYQTLKTVTQKTCVADRIKGNWPTGSLIQVAKIKPSDVDMWLASYYFGSASRNFHIQILKDLFDVAVRDRIILVSPAQHLKYAKRDKPIRRTPTFEQFQAIVESIRSQEFNGHDADESADFVEFIGLAGLGQAEASALEWDDVDWKREHITTFRHKTKAGFVIPLYPQLRPLLERRHAQKSPDDDRVFKIKDAKRAIAAACKRLKLPAYSHRSFRRMFITRAIEKGVDVKVIAEWQGHKDGGKLILETYSHVNPVHSKRMAQLMTTEQPENVVPMTKGAAS